MIGLSFSFSFYTRCYSKQDIMKIIPMIYKFKQGFVIMH